MQNIFTQRYSNRVHEAFSALYSEEIIAEFEKKIAQFKNFIIAINKRADI